VGEERESEGVLCLINTSSYERNGGACLEGLSVRSKGDPFAMTSFEPPIRISAAGMVIKSPAGCCAEVPGTSTIETNPLASTASRLKTDVTDESPGPLNVISST